MKQPLLALLPVAVPPSPDPAALRATAPKLVGFGSLNDVMDAVTTRRAPTMSPLTSRC